MPLMEDMPTIEHGEKSKKTQIQQPYKMRSDLVSQISRNQNQFSYGCFYQPCFNIIKFEARRTLWASHQFASV